MRRAYVRKEPCAGLIGGARRAEEEDVLDAWKRSGQAHACGSEGQLSRHSCRRECAQQQRARRGAHESRGRSAGGGVRKRVSALTPPYSVGSLYTILEASPSGVS